MLDRLIIAAAIVSRLSDVTGVGGITCQGLAGSVGRCGLEYEFAGKSWVGDLYGAEYVEDLRCAGTGRAVRYERGVGHLGTDRWHTGSGSMCVPGMGTLGGRMGAVDWDTPRGTRSTTLYLTPHAVTSTSLMGASEMDLDD